VSYDGACEPLGRSQVVAYLLRLARDCDITLISFEKDQASRDDMARLLGAAGVRWRPMRYHKRPPVLSTLLDVLAGARAVRSACADGGADIVHVRSYVPALIALVAASRKRPRWKLLFDIRGFWVEERVAGGLWRPRGLLVRIAKRCERQFFARADAVVTLTSASVPEIRRLLAGRTVPVVVIPTCAEVERFADAEPSAGGSRAVWCGSVGSFYRFDLAVRFAEALELPLMVLTRQIDTAMQTLDGRPADVREVRPTEIAGELRPQDIGMCFYVDDFSNLARAPTRFAEYLAAGMTVAVTPRIGDLDALLGDLKLGVCIEDETTTGLERAAHTALALIKDPARTERARSTANERFAVDTGVAAYRSLYAEVGQV
jgi:glycosyltransferase involved in cell wall biosynthesis